MLFRIVRVLQQNDWKTRNSEKKVVEKYFDKNVIKSPDTDIRPYSKTGSTIIIFIIAVVLLAIGSVILGINSIYEKINYLMSSKERRKQKELEAQIEAKSTALAVNDIKQLVEWEISNL